MRVSIIAAMDEQNIIGADGALPWRLPDDLQNFKRITLGKPIIMGRKTHESIARPLPGRDNIILTRQKNYHSKGCVVCHTLQQALTQYAEQEEALIIGGAELYHQTINKAHRLYLTRVHTKVKGDTYFPHYNPSEWRQTHQKKFAQDKRNEYAFSFQILEKISP